ncbi:MAG: type I-E CRISPR-associated protein Cse2/CasB [Deltaproteobacteria bacterium]|nr:type I-E CRISPR-associated protein Cse2/CasB [Deltaproteobacteria bacterium]MBW1987527.1 type I-E CRISPR-associated protein Cse2/CasB [Deltaproteobacteria bacterium]
MNPPSEQEYDFIGYLERLVIREDRGALAALRRGLGSKPGTAIATYPYVVPFLTSVHSAWEEATYFTIASLFAYWHQGRNTVAANPPENLGASFARLASEVQSNSIEQRFTALLNSHRDDLPVHLRHAVGLLKSREISINWRQLLRHLRYWDHEDQFVQRTWAKSFWVPPQGGKKQLDHQ